MIPMVTETETEATTAASDNVTGVVSNVTTALFTSFCRPLVNSARSW